jgi:hypothetical protein
MPTPPNSKPSEGETGTYLTLSFKMIMRTGENPGNILFKSLNTTANDNDIDHF